MTSQNNPTNKTIPQSRNLIITGLMGSGKTTVGRLVAQHLDRDFIDTDEYIETHHGPTSEILSQPDGDQLFKQTEEMVARTLASREMLVISTGGRFMINNHNIRTMQAIGNIICLHAELNELVARLLHKNNNTTYRPRFENAPDKLALMEDLQRQSEPYLNQFQQWNTNGSSASEIAKAIAAWYRTITNNGNKNQPDSHT